MKTRRIHLAVVMVLAAACLAVLEAAGSDRLASPPASSWRESVSWYEAVGPDAAAVAFLRLIAMAGLAWLVLAGLLQLLATFSPSGAFGRLADSVSPRALRRLAHGAAGLSVAVGLAGPTAPAVFAQDPPGTAVMEQIDDAVTSTTETTAVPVAVVPPAPKPPAVTTPTADPPQDQVEVVVGDSFWSIAAEAVADARGAEPDERAVCRYWQRLIEENRSQLVDPTNPDLLYPGQRLVLPAP